MKGWHRDTRGRLLSNRWSPPAGHGQAAAKQAYTRNLQPRGRGSKLARQVPLKSWATPPASGSVGHINARKPLPLPPQLANAVNGPSVTKPRFVAASICRRYAGSSQTGKRVARTSTLRQDLGSYAPSRSDSPPAELTCGRRPWMSESNCHATPPAEELPRPRLPCQECLLQPLPPAVPAVGSLQSM